MNPVDLKCAVSRSTVRAMGILIGQLLEADGLTQVRFAKAVGVSTRHLSQVIGGRKSAHPDTLDQWATALGCRFSVSLECIDPVTEPADIEDTGSLLVAR